MNTRPANYAPSVIQRWSTQVMSIREGLNQEDVLVEISGPNVAPIAKASFTKKRIPTLKLMKKVTLVVLLLSF